MNNCNGINNNQACVWLKDRVSDRLQMAFSLDVKITIIFFFSYQLVDFPNTVTYVLVAFCGTEEHIQEGNVHISLFLLLFL